MSLRHGNSRQVDGRRGFDAGWFRLEDLSRMLKQSASLSCSCGLFVVWCGWLHETNQMEQTDRACHRRADPRSSRATT
jgi:hypothetical protein